jgi:hypothetical protein
MIDRWIVVGGCPRSGTTLVGNALGAAEAAIVTPEAQFASERACGAGIAGRVAARPARHHRIHCGALALPHLGRADARTHGRIFSACASGGALCSAHSSAVSCRNMRAAGASPTRASGSTIHPSIFARSRFSLTSITCTASMSSRRARGGGLDEACRLGAA